MQGFSFYARDTISKAVGVISEGCFGEEQRAQICALSGKMAAMCK